MLGVVYSRWRRSGLVAHGREIALATAWVALALTCVSCLEPFPSETTTAAKATQRGGAAQPEKQGAARKAQPSGPAAGGPKGEKPKEPEQTYGEAWSLMCRAETLAGVDPNLGRDKRGAAVANWIVAHVKNKDARYWFLSLGSIKVDERAATFRAEAARAGVSPCPLETLLFAKGTSGPKP